MTDPEYFEALRRLNTLLTRGFEPNSPAAAEASALQLVVDLYETEIGTEENA